MITMVTNLLCTNCGEVLEFKGGENLSATCLKCGEKHEQVDIMPEEEKNIFAENLKTVLLMYQKIN